MKKTILFLLIGLASLQFNAKSQEIEILNIQLRNGEVEIRYNLLDTRVDRTYAINLYTSKDNFIQPVENVSGDVGVDIAVGTNKKLLWNARKEFGEDFDEDISLELKGNYYVPFITMTGIKEGREFKRGKSYDLVWSGGRGDNILLFQLYKNGNIIKDFEERANTGNTKFTIPRDISPGDHYQLKISDANNSDEVVFTEEFVVKRKYPLFMQIGAGVIAGVGIYALINFLQPEEPYEVPLPDTPNR